MKKLISLLLSLVFLFTFISCSKADENYGVTSEAEVSSDVSSVTKSD